MLMPIKFQLRKYLESAGVLKTILDHLSPSKDGYVRTVVDGTVWQARTDPAKTVIPLNLFFDDFTTTDTVSPHAASTSICGIYYYIPCLPSYVLSKLVNILIAGYVLTEDRKLFSNDVLFTSLIDILIELETDGLEISYEGNSIRVYFMLAFITGDNLGLSGILDLVESTRANFYCRMCKRNYEQRQTDLIEYSKSLRTRQNYESDLQLADPSQTGIKNNCVFNKIPSFHLVCNVYFDVMHDLWEGVCLYGLQHCLHYFITIKKYFSLDDLNRRKNLFVFGKLNSSNIPNDIKELNFAKNKLRMTASEVKTFVTFIPLIIGDKIPTNDEVWLYFCNLLKICHILMLRQVNASLIHILRNLVSNHHEQYQHLFNDTLKPKHHNLVHYSSFILSSGTPRHQWAMRGEAKHKEAKQYCRSNNNKLNLCKSLGIKVGYKFAYNVINNVFIPPAIDLSESKRTPHDQSSQYLNKFTKYGSVYAQGTIFVIDYGSMIKLFELERILIDRDENISLIGLKIQYQHFNEHLQSFEVIKTSEAELISNINHVNIRATNLHTLNGKLYYRYCNLNVSIN